MAGSAVPKMIAVYYNAVEDEKLINECREDAKKYGMSLSTMIKYLLKDRMFVVNNINSEFFRVREMIKAAKREKIEKKREKENKK